MKIQSSVEDKNSSLNWSDSLYCLLLSVVCFLSRNVDESIYAMYPCIEKASSVSLLNQYRQYPSKLECIIQRPDRQAALPVGLECCL